MKLNGFSNYEIYPEEGKIYSTKRKKFIKPRLKKDGYLGVTIYNDKKEQISFRLHRLIWIAVNGKTPEGMQVNHINEDKMNNSIFNLNLMTPKENCNWGTRNDRVGKANKNNSLKSKSVIALQNGVIKLYFPSTMEAQRTSQMNNALISECALGKRKTHKGYQWMYVDNYLAEWWDKEYMN